MVLNNGAWTQETADAAHQSSPKLAAWIADFLSTDRPVIDLGCGIGYYVNYLRERGFEAFGIEGYKLNNFVTEFVLVRDLTKPLVFKGEPHVITLEVGEHIPKEHEQTFLDTITNSCGDKLVMSWALPGQPGIGHINCQPREYIIAEVERRGFRYLPELTEEAKQHVDDNCDWFRRTLLIFERVKQ